MILAKHKLNVINQEERAKDLKIVKQNFFEYANKLGRWLAHKLKIEWEKRLIPELRDDNGNLQHQMVEKKRIVQNYFEGLYKEEKVNKDNIEQYLKENGLPEIREEQREM
uniref:Uncharacterized protein n=1 Tax=Micrurus surinamensis TaxID=129470 RepID=A0A2D4PSY4_MICSU